MLESVGDDAVDGDADNDVVGDADDDAVAGPGSCGSSCWVPSSREHTGPRNQVSPVPRAAGGTRLHVDETTPIDRYPRSIRAPGGVPLHGGQRCSRDSQGHGVTCHEDIPINQELPSPGASRHAESGYVCLFFQDRSCPIVLRPRNTPCGRVLPSQRAADSFTRDPNFFESLLAYDSASSSSRSQKTNYTLVSFDDPTIETQTMSRPSNSSRTPDQGTASQSRECNRRSTTAVKRNIERSMVGRRESVGIVASPSGSRGRRDGRRHSLRGTTRRPYIDLCASGAEAGETERTNPTNERTWNESRERKERSPLGGSAPRRAAPRISNGAARAHLVARFVPHGRPRLCVKTTELDTVVFASHVPSSRSRSPNRASNQLSHARA